jgi:histidinol-phosphatase (PHP family)
MIPIMSMTSQTEPKRTTALYDSHMHTPLCKHATGQPTEYADVAQARGLTGVIFTCHNPLPDRISLSVRMEEAQFDEYVQLIHDAADARRGQVDIRLGLECDYWPGLEPYLEKQLARAAFHHVLGSVHPQIGYYQAMFPAKSELEFQKTYFTHLAMAAESGLFDTLSHPDLVKNQFQSSWDVELLFPHICACLDRIAAAGTAMELNTSGLNKAIPEFNPGPEMLREMARRKIPIVLGSDSHVPTRVSADFEKAIDVLRLAGYEDVSCFLDRQRVVIALDDAQSLLTRTSAA